MDIQYFDDIAHKAVRLPLKGVTLAIGGKWYEVLRTVTEQDNPGEFVTTATIAELDDEGDRLDKAPIDVNLDMLDYSY
jgi:hypothetical protein